MDIQPTLRFSKRVTGIRYIFNRKLSPGEERSGYEVLGVLIVIQLAIQLFQWRRQRAAEAKEMAAAAATLGDKGAIQQQEAEEEEEMEEEELDEVSQSTAQVNPECPLCRQHVQLSALLPIYTKLY
ncbi:hypothetical protein BGZ75_007191 [Mortierella antarctica]|nr:hypothetical protein BGZ75_007191 [Mortierella antarctica]